SPSPIIGAARIFAIRCDDMPTVSGLATGSGGCGAASAANERISASHAARDARLQFMVLLLLTCSEDSRDLARPAWCSPARRLCAPDPAAPAGSRRSTSRSFHTTNPGAPCRRTRRRLLEAKRWQGALRPPEKSLQSGGV